MRNTQTIALLLMFWLGMHSSAVLAQANEAQIQGRVSDADGLPLRDVMVVISSAAPKQRLATREARHCGDCGALATTDVDGRFLFDGLDPELNYQLAFSASGFQGTLIDFKPDINGDFDVELSKNPAEQSNRIQGRVVDANGRPIIGAIITPREINLGNITTSRNKGLATPLVLTDDLGEFELFATDEVTGVKMRAAAKGLAISEVQYSMDSAGLCEIELNRGASIRGRLVFQGQPSARVKLGLVQEDRTSRSIVTPLEVATDEEGFFQFDHLPQDLEYTLYTLLQQDAKCVLPVSLVRAPPNGKRAELGDVTASFPKRLSIRIRTEDEQALPDKSVVFVSRRWAWQSGRFSLAGQVEPLLEITDASAEMYEIAVHVPGYRVSRTVPLRSPDINRHYRITVDGDTSIVFLLVKSE